MREYLLSAAAVIALMSSGVSAHDKPATFEAQGKADEAMLVRQEFNDAWRTAEIEPDLDTM